MIINIILTAASVAVAISMCWFVYAQDKVEKEPVKLLALLLGAGAVAFVPVMFAQNALYKAEANAFGDNRGLAFVLVGAFCITSLIAEAVKLGVLTAITRKSKYFDYMFDGVVYSVFLSMGYGIADNIRAAIENTGDAKAILIRLATSMPAHIVYGVIMGILYSIWHAYDLANSIEEGLRAQNKLSKNSIRPGKFLVAALLAPTAIHGAFSTLSVIDFKGVSILRTVVIIIAAVICFVIVGKTSKQDEANVGITKHILEKFGIEEDF